MRPSAIHSEPAVHHLIFCEQKWLSPSKMDEQRQNPCCLDSLQAYVAPLRWMEMETSIKIIPMPIPCLCFGF